MEESKSLQQSNIAVPTVVSQDDIDKLVSFFSILIKIDRKVGKANEKNNDRKRTRK